MESENKYSSNEYNYTPVRKGKGKSPIARRSQMISVIKWLLILSAIVLLATLIAFPIINNQKQKAGEFHFVFPLASSDDISSPRMTKPRLYGTDKYNRPYSVTADRAVQQEDNKILLDSIFAEVTMKKTRWFSMIADEGLVHVGRQTLDTFGNIHIVSDDGFEMRTSAAHFNMKQGNVTGVHPVDVTGPLGTLKAQGFVIEENGKILRFDGRVKLKIYTEPREEG